MTTCDLSLIGLGETGVYATRRFRNLTSFSSFGDNFVRPRMRER